jgi:hypothetical protein
VEGAHGGTEFLLSGTSKCLFAIIMGTTTVLWKASHEWGLFAFSFSLADPSWALGKVVTSPLAGREPRLLTSSHYTTCPGPAHGRDTGLGPECAH